MVFFPCICHLTQKVGNTAQKREGSVKEKRPHRLWHRASTTKSKAFNVKREGKRKFFRVIKLPFCPGQALHHQQ